MSIVTPIPSWTPAGVLPPNDASRPSGEKRSPDLVSLAELVQRLATSPERRLILEYRSRLHALGLVSGFQWLDGSFLEHIELIEGRNPRDLDVVTYYHLPAGTTQAELFERDRTIFPATLGEKRAFKERFHVDPYLLDLSQAPEQLVTWSAYWYSMWSHRRDAQWKGFVQVTLDSAEDSVAVANLRHMQSAGGSP